MGRPPTKPTVSSVPELIGLWHPDNTLDPKTITTGSDKKVLWKCPNHDFPYSASPLSMVRGRRCNVCTGKKVVSGYNDVGSTGRNYISQWDHARNPPITEVSAQSNKKVWWKCTLNHSWEESPYFRLRRGDGCPICLNKKVLADFNDLATTDPEIASEWDYSRNTLTPTEVTRGSDTKVWWVCRYGHSWETWIYARTSTHGNGCPICWASSTSSSIEKELAALLPGSTSPYTTQLMWKSGRRMTVDILLKEGNIVVEYDGWWWHRNTQERDTYKTENLIRAGFRVIRIRENDLSMLPSIPGMTQIRYYPREEILQNLADIIKHLAVDLLK